MTNPKFALPKNRNLLPLPTINISSEEPLGPMGIPLIQLGSVDSTNNYAIAQVHAGLASHGIVFMAQHQTAGKGQRGKSWTTEAGQNLTLSAVLEPGFLEPRHQFMLSAATALACLDLLGKSIYSGLHIKWPNDLYWNDRKAGGILIESISQGNRLCYAVAGVGLNINQVRFPEELQGRAVSVRQITGKTWPLATAASEWCKAMDSRFRELQHAGLAQILDQYNQHLYRRGQRVRLKQGDRLLDVVVGDVTATGQLRTADPEAVSFELGEVEWII